MAFLTTLPDRLRQRSHTFYVWLILVMLLVLATCAAARWQRNEVFVNDMGDYYMYLPSAFLTHDLGDGSWVKAARVAYRPDMDPQWAFITLPNGRVLFKFSMGMAVAYAPFFFLAEGILALKGQHHSTGYEPMYQYLVTFGCVLYVVLGLWLLGLELRRYFADPVVALTLLVVTVGSNLFTYGSFDVLMAHGTLFLLSTLLVRHTRRWYAHGRRRDAATLGLVLGLMALIRPSELMLLAVPLLWGLTDRAALAGRLRFWGQRWLQVLAAAALLVLVAGQQLVFWRVVGGQWLVTFYKGETFHFDDPHLLDGLFSIQKGWLVYSPLMALALVGIGWVRRWAAPALPVLLGLVPVYFYVTFCWWNWQYGGSYGGRALISLYPLLAFGLAAFWQRWLRAGRWAWLPLLTLLLTMSLIQNQQYAVGMIDCCYMTWDMYKQRFLLLHF